MSRVAAAVALAGAAVWMASSAPVRAQPDAAPSGAVAILLQQASFWSSQQQYDQALASLRRALDIDPHSIDALAMAGRIEADRGDRAAAAAMVARLRILAPDDPRLEGIEGALRIGPISPEALAEARRLARDGRQAEAVKRYTAILRGNPPPDSLAVEYYQTLSGTSDGWEQAREGLARVVTRDPQDLHAQLAYAQVLTYREETRVDGLQRLEALTRDPAVADSATQCWRRALLWVPSTPDWVPILQRYVAQHPGDIDLRSKLAAAEAAGPPVDSSGKARQLGFDQLNAGHLDEATRSFGQALETDSNDADALGGMGIVRLRQGKLAEARTFLERAVAVDPGHRDRWEAALLAGRRSPGDPNPATLLMQRGDYGAAERELRKQIGRSAVDPGLAAMLGDALAQQGRLAEAEQAYRGVLSKAPDNSAALLGLADVLARRGQTQASADVLERAQNVGAGALAGQARARLLREQARLDTDDPQTQLGLLRAAVQTDPASPWTRLDLARLLVRQGRLAEARATMAAGLAGTPNAEAVRAGVIFARETDDPEAVAALVARLPAAAQTPDMRASAAASALQRDIALATALPAQAAREQLLLLAAQPDEDGSRGTSITRALAALNQPDSVREALATAQAATPGSPPSARIAYAGVLLGLGDVSGARRMLANTNGTKLTENDRIALAAVRSGIAIRAADRLNEVGRQAEAFDELAPMLEVQPDNPEAILALARLYQGADRPREALKLAERLLARDSANAAARRTAVDAALATGQATLAAQIAQRGRALTPDDPRSWIATADVARARGDPEVALGELLQARTLHERQAAALRQGEDTTASPSRADGSLDTGPFGRSRNDSSAPIRFALPNPFRAPAAMGDDAEDQAAEPPAAPRDKMTEQIERNIATLQEQVAPATQASVAYRERSGQAGLDRLVDASVPLRAEFSLGGRIRSTVTATPVFLGSGSVPQDVGTSARFGLNALALASILPPPALRDQSAGGVGLAAAASVGSLKADIGLTPLGFQETNVVGGVEWAPLLFEQARLKVSADRRAVTDSLLSYAGTKIEGDATLARFMPAGAAGRWGGVVFSQGRVGLEVSLGPLRLYGDVSGGVLTGRGVQHNTEVGADAGASFPLYTDNAKEVRIGLDLVYFGYDHNLRFFSYGQGGYFSPQSYFTALLPLTYREEIGPNLAYEMGVSVGLQSFREQESPLYPTRPDLQARLQQLAALVPGLQASYPGHGVTGFAGGAHASLDYRVARNLHVGARFAYQHAEHYDQASGLIYGQYVFSGHDPPYP